MQWRNFIVILNGFWFLLGAWTESAALAQKQPLRTRSIPIAVIVHPTQQESNISLSELRLIFLKQKQSLGSINTLLVLNWEAKNPLRVAFDRQVAQMDPEQIANYWLDNRIRGYGMPPRSLKSSSLIQRIVLSQKDTISYVRLDEIRENVKILKIDGKRPGEPGYPLHLELNP